MKRRFLMVMLALVLVLLLAACGCEHEWQDASCTAPKTCQLCGETEGEALGHTWQDASCTAPKTCSACNITEGEALDHDWQEATTEEPKTCRRCKLTEGERIITDSRFTTKATQLLQGTWACDVKLTAEMMGLATGFPNGIDCTLFMVFGNAGELTNKLELNNEDAFKQDYREFIMEATYATLAQQGVGKKEADAAMLQAYGLNMEQYVDSVLQSIDMGAMFSAFNVKEVYYVADDKIYTALSWESQLFEESPYTLDKGILTIDAIALEEGGTPLQWKKAE